MSISKPLGVALIGAGRIGSLHAESVACRLVDADLIAIADPAPGAANKLADQFGVARLLLDRIVTNPTRTLIRDGDLSAVQEGE